MKHLSPNPGAAYSSGRTAYIRPDVVVEWDGDDYAVRLENDWVPRLERLARATASCSRRPATTPSCATT